MVSMLFTFLLLVSVVEEPAIEADVVLQEATLCDGTGKAKTVGDLAIKGERIVAVGKFKVRGNVKTINCKGLIIAPGFIDLHSHSDRSLPKKATKANKNFLMQGATTVITGNCGSGPVNVAGYYKTLDDNGVGTNVIHLVPHNSLRRQVMGNSNRSPTKEELKKMQDLVDKGMKDGAFGMSTGLIYNPGTYAKTEELIALAKIVKNHDGLYASHIRNESNEVLLAIAEILRIARILGIRVHISHIKVSGRSAWGLAGNVVAMIRRAREDGHKVTADQYPYIASSTSLTATVIPAKFREGSNKDMIARLDDKEIGPKMRTAMSKRLKGLLDGKVIRIVSYRANPKWQGKDLFSIARDQNKSTLDMVIEITRKGGAGIVNFSMNEEEVRIFMKEPYVATASDGSSMLPSKTVPHPRNYGTFPRKIRKYALEDKIIPLEQAIRSATGLPADILKLPKRGYLKKGYFADVVVFDPKSFRDTATFDRPHQYATGVRQLYINGQHVIVDGEFTGKLAGKALRHVSGD